MTTKIKERSPLLIRVVARKSPIMKNPIGSYLQTAVPNDAPGPFGRPGPSFEKPYKVYADHLVEGEGDVLRILEWLDKRHVIIPVIKEDA